jgi:hypothetical protein
MANMKSELDKKLAGGFHEKHATTEPDHKGVHHELAPKHKVKVGQSAFKAMSREQCLKAYQHVHKSEAPPPGYYNGRWHSVDK